MLFSDALVDSVSAHLSTVFPSTEHDPLIGGCSDTHSTIWTPRRAITLAGSTCTRIGSHSLGCCEMV